MQLWQQLHGIQQITDTSVEADILLVGAILVLESGEEIIDLDEMKALGFESLKSTSYGKKTSLNIFIYRG